MISPMVLNTPTVLKISPHGTHDIPHDTEHPPWYCTHIIQGDSQNLDSEQISQEDQPNVDTTDSNNEKINQQPSESQQNTRHK